eukprot:g16243.t1
MAKKGGRSPFAGQGGPFGGGAEERAGGDRDGAGVRGGRASAATEPERVPSIESEVTRMLDESKGTLRLVRDGLGDERVPCLSLERLKEAYQTGRGSVCSWRVTASPANGEANALIRVEQGRLGVLSSHEAYLVEFKETKPSLAPTGDPAQQLASIDEGEAEEEEFQLVYLWIGARAGVEACEAARAQGKRLLERGPSSTSRTPLLEVEQGCEPALFLALFSYMLPPLAAVVLQGRDETPELRVLELQESPCLNGSGIVIAVEGPCSASLLAQHGPLPGRSYICLVRPRRCEVGCAKDRGGVKLEGGGSVGTFDAAYYWHGVGEAPAVEEVGILLCQQVDRMFPSPPSDDCGKRRGGGRRRRRPGGVGLGGGMMRGFVADVKLGLPVPEGFWECLLPEGPTPYSVSASQDRRLLSQDLRPESRSRPVRVFGVCGGSKKARQSFVWEVTTGGMPSQMRLSPSLSYVVDAGASRVYVWHGIGSSRDDSRLACLVASAYAARVQGGASVEQADAGSEPIGLLDCFIGWNQALVEPPPILSPSPGRRPSELESNADLSSLETPTPTEGKDSAAVGSAAGKRALPDLERTSRCADGATGEGCEYPKNTVQTCGAGGHDESGAGNDDRRCAPSGDGGRENNERTGHNAGKSGRDEGKEERGPRGRQGNGRDGGGDKGGGGQGGDDDDGPGNNGNGTLDMGNEEIDEDEDGEEEAEERDAEEEMETFLRLSEVDFCEGIKLARSSTAARDSSISSPSGVGGGNENVRVISRQLSDFFRSPLALDSTPKRSSSSIWSLSDVQTGARLFDSLKSPGSDDDGALSENGSGNPLIPAFSHAVGSVGGTSYEMANSVLISCVGSPPPSASPAAGSAAGIPDSGAAAAIAAYSRDDTEHTQTAEIDELPAETSNVCEPAAVEVDDEPRESEQTEAVEEETKQSDNGRRDEPAGDGGGGESDEEWLTGGVVEPTPERWPNLNATSTSTQEADSKAERTAAAVGTHWAGLNEDGSWRTESARKAAGKAGEVEAECRRLAKIIADESWRSDAGEVDGAGRRGRRNARRDSVIRLQSGNVRNKLNAFQGGSGSNIGRVTADNRSSIGALHGRGLVSAWTKKCTVRASAATTAQAVLPSAPSESRKEYCLCRGEDPTSPSGEEGARLSPAYVNSTDEQSDEFVWKAGPAPCRLQGRPSLGLIRNGQVRIMTKALLLSCPEGGDEEAGESTRNCEEADVNRDGNSLDGSVEPPLPLRPPPSPPRAAEGTAPPLPERPSPGATPPRNGGARQQGGGTRTPPPTFSAGRTAAGGAVAAKVLDAIDSYESPSIGATGAWAKLRRRLKTEGEKLSGKDLSKTCGIVTGAR